MVLCTSHSGIKTDSRPSTVLPGDDKQTNKTVRHRYNLPIGRSVEGWWLWTPRTLRFPRWTPPRLTTPSLWWPWRGPWSSRPPDQTKTNKQKNLCVTPLAAKCTASSAVSRVFPSALAEALKVKEAFGLKGALYTLQRGTFKLFILIVLCRSWMRHNIGSKCLKLHHN